MQGKCSLASVWPKATWCYRGIYGWLLSMLDLEACGGDLAIKCGRLPLISGLGQLSRRPRAPLGQLPSAGSL